MDIYTFNDFDKFIELWESYGSIQISSTLNWPEDITTNPDLIYMCDLISGNNISGHNHPIKETTHA